MDIRTPRKIRNITITLEILKFIAEIDEFRGCWKVMQSSCRYKCWRNRVFRECTVILASPSRDKQGVE